MLSASAIGDFYRPRHAAAARHQLAMDYTVSRRLIYRWAASSSGHVSCNRTIEAGITPSGLCGITGVGTDRNATGQIARQSVCRRKHHE